MRVVTAAYTLMVITPMRNWEDSLQLNLALILFFPPATLYLKFYTQIFPSETLMLSNLSLNKQNNKLLEWNIAPTLCRTSANQKIIESYTAKYSQGQAYSAHFPIVWLRRSRKSFQKLSMKEAASYNYLEAVSKRMSNQSLTKDIFFLLKKKTYLLKKLN